MIFTLLGIVKVVRLEQPWNALLPISVSPSESVKDANEEQLRKTELKS